MQSKLKSLLLITLLALPWAAALARAVPYAAPASLVPTMVSYQGQVKVSGIPFDGMAYFKFAIVDSAGTRTLWSHDGSSVGGAEPTSHVSLPVAGGLFNVLLGDTSVPNMTEELLPGHVAQAHGYLRVWFSDDGSSFEQLNPDRRIASVPYALLAEEADNANSLRDYAPGNSSGRIPINNSTLNSDLNADLLDGRHAGDLEVPSGAMVLGLPNDTRITGAGYNALGATNVTCQGYGGSWQITSNTSAPTGREKHTAVWTGSEMIVWGGYDGSDRLNSGARYDAQTDTWTPVSTVDAPSARESHTAVWTGSEMIVWGGYNGSDYLNTGGRYDPDSDTWTAITTVDAPTGRHRHTAVWTGSEMIVWGGAIPAAQRDGGRYDPAMDTWAATSLTAAPVAREMHTAVWTGSEMIVWGGSYGATARDDGARYDPDTDAWSAVTATGAPAARSIHTAVWTGSEMLLWGGYSNIDGYQNTGGRYDPSTDTWLDISTTDAPTGRWIHTAVWTGSEMWIWGGADPSYLLTGGRYTPYADTWADIPTTGAPAKRRTHTAVWTGSEMIIWGGHGSLPTYKGDGRRYSHIFYLYQKP
jgi:N-acetylneuraminic acid mutarotase